MALISTKRGNQIRVHLGDGGDPETFTYSALINTSRGFTITANAESAEIVDATDPSLPAETQRVTKSTDTKIDGSGIMHSTDVKTWMDWALSGEPKNVKIIGMGATLTGLYLLTSFSISADNYTTAEVQATLEQASTPTVTTEA